MSVKFTDNSAEVLTAFEEACLRGLEKCGLVAEGYAKKLAPVDSGLLRNSISRVGKPFFDFDYPHGNIGYSHWHGWAGPGLTGRNNGAHWNYLELIWWMFGGK